MGSGIEVAECRAVTDELSDGTHKGVVGAFGATLDEHTPPAAPDTN